MILTAYKGRWVFIAYIAFIIQMAEIELRPQSPSHVSSDDELILDISLKLQLQGQCKIRETKLLEISYLKIITLTLPIIVSIFGLFLLKYYKHLRTKAFYWQDGQITPTHIYIKGNGSTEEDIVSLEKQGSRTFFTYKNLKYQLLPNRQHIPLALNYQKQLQKRLGSKFLEEGLSTAEAMERKKLYGLNEHIVDPPKYYDYMYEVMTEPYFLIQYLASTIYIIQKLIEPAILLLSATIITTSINYLLLYISYRKIKELAEIVVEVEVLRDGRFMSLPSNQLVPGDVFIPKQDLYCDVVLVNGEVYVNQANLTGESVPIGKFALDSFAHYRKEDTSRWIYEGSKLLSTHNPLALVMHTGYSSKRGRILRKILHRTSATPHFFTTCIYFLLVNWVIGMLIYLGTMPVRLANDNLQRIIIFLNFLLVLTFCIPPSCPIFFNVVYSFSLIRLKWKDILGTQPQKTVEAAHLRIMCFDKTGTLTEDKMEVNKVFNFQKQKHMNITNRGQQERGIDEKLFGSCHTVKSFQGQLMGDEIDLKMFNYSQYRLSTTCEQGSCFDVLGTENLQEIKLNVIKVYQYQSRFQSMSVLVHDKATNKYFVFSKGAPQVIHNNSTVKYDYFQGLLQNVSYGGFRTIGYGYKEIPKDELALWVNYSREMFLRNNQMLGLLVFENKLKKDSAPTIALLREAGIDSRIITGDNIYIAIETAIRCGILARQQEVVVIEGHEQQLNQNEPIQDQNIKIKRFAFRQQKINVQKENLQYQDYLDINNPVIIDNDFLKLQAKFPHFQFTSRIKVYARISPQNKALVVRKLKETFKKNREELPVLKRIMSMEIDKVGMVGDGANDLLAIKEADIGIGIRNCDSSYAASFSIIELSGLDQIVRQSKCCQMSIIEIVRFICISSLLNVPLIVMMETQAVFFSPFQLIFVNLTKYILFPILLAVSRPSQKQTVHKPSSNFLRLQHQLMHWGNAIIGTIAMIAIMLYYRSQAEYVWNTTTATLSTGWVFQSSHVTSQFIFNNLYPIGLVLAVYVSSPWKEPIYKNYLLLISIILNLASSVVITYLIPQLMSLFTFTNMSIESISVIFGITMFASLATVIFSELVNWMKLYVAAERVYPSKDERMAVERMESAEGTRNR